MLVLIQWHYFLDRVSRHVPGIRLNDGDKKIQELMFYMSVMLRGYRMGCLLGQIMKNL
jgi:hypothetical protein